MAKAGVTDIGMKELHQSINAFPRDVTLALRAVAWQSSRRIMARAQEILRSKTSGTGKTADAIHVVEFANEKRFAVTPGRGNPDRPENLPLWLEFGTRFMVARPYLRPAADEENPRYQRGMEDAARKVADGAFR